MNRTNNLDLSLPGRRPHAFPRNLWEALRTTTAAKRRLALLVFVVAWLPIFLGSAFQSLDSLRVFLLDFAAQSRLLLVLPLLILMEQPLLARYNAIAREFRVAGLLKPQDIPRAERLFDRFVARRGSSLAQVVIVSLVGLLIASAIHNSPGENMPPWCLETRGVLALSFAGYWYVLVALPVVAYLLIRWLWDMLLWAGFLSSMSRLDLQLVPSHPDLMGGLGFLESSLRAYLPLAFSIGTIFAGGVTNQILYHHQSLSGYKSLAFLIVAVVVLICVTPLCTFFGLLNQTKRRGIFEYGALAIRLGQQFEHKWLPENRPTTDASILEVPDFSATTDLYSVAANVHRMSLYPIGLRSVARLVVVTLIPGIPVILMSLPFDVLLEKIAKLLL